MLTEHERTPMMCRQCRLAVNRMAFPGEVPTWVHSRSWLTFDHEPDPVPAQFGEAELTCDFCGTDPPQYVYHGGEVTALIGRTDNNYGTRWVGCRDCDVFVRRRDVARLVDRAIEVSVLKDGGSQSAGAVRAEITRLLSAYVPSITRRELYQPVTRVIPKLTARMMPKIRDRLARFWTADASLQGIRAELADGPVALPGVDVDHPGSFAVRVTEPVADESLAAFQQRMASGLFVSDLYWVSGEFTHLAVGAGQELPDLTLTREELPSPHGFVIWELPVTTLTPPALQRPVDVVAASWTLVPDGIWVALYAQPEQCLNIDPVDLPTLRQEVGWLMVFSPGGGIQFGTEPVPNPPELLRTLLSTWFLMSQPGVAAVETKPADKALRRAYARAQRPAPEVRVVDLRRHASRDADQPQEAPQRTYSVRWMVRGHWKNQAYGPARSLRKRIYVAPFLKGPDNAPLKTDVPIVKALR